MECPCQVGPIEPWGDEDDFEIEPFCRHWDYPDNCEHACASCGHLCGKHGPDHCEEIVTRSGLLYDEEHICDCEEWNEP